MIYAHKILPYFLMPLTLAMLLLAAGFIFRRRRAVLAGLCVLYVFSIPLTGDFLFHVLERGTERIPARESRTADAIVVLSGAGVVEKGKGKVIEWDDPDRFFGGVQLFHAGKAPLLVFTGGWLPWNAGARPEGELLVEQAVLHGVPADCAVTTGRVSNTEQEADAAAQLLRELQKNRGDEGTTPRVLLVTSAYHMRRARSLFERAGVEVVPFPVDFRNSPAGNFSLPALLPSASGLIASETALREIYGRFYYWLRR
jgi:uncharacterized SAM-binding protein YcdF (DUF218 family)